MSTSQSHASRAGWLALAVAVLFGAQLIAPLAPTANALPQSIQVAIIGGTGVINGGGLFNTAPAFSPFTFTTLLASGITAAGLASYDTVVLNVASSDLGCQTTGLSASAKADLVAFVASGKKMIIYDSECTFGGAVDYSWLPYPFTTDNPGATGGTGTLSIVEENFLSCSDPSAACFIDVNAVGPGTDAVGDSNAVLTLDPNWCGDMLSINVNGVEGFSHMYANAPNGGLYIYNGLDVDALGGDPLGTGGSNHLAKIWLRELLQPWAPSNLPCSTPVICKNAPAVITVDITSPALGFDYYNNVPTAQNPVAPVSRVLGPLTLSATTSDPALTGDVTIFVDGSPRATFNAPPYTWNWDPLLEPVPDGMHTILVRAIENAPGGCPRSASRNVLVPASSMGGHGVAVSFGNAVPVTNELTAIGAHVPDPATGGHEQRTIVDHYVAQADVRIEGGEDITTGTAVGSLREVRSSSQIARVTLAAGQIVAEGIRSEAYATLDRATLTGFTGVGETYIAKLTIAGVPGMPLAASVPPNTGITLPDGSFVMLNEQIVTMSGGRYMTVVNAIHVYADPTAARSEIIIGQAVAGVDLLGRTFFPLVRSIDAQNDADLGGDAGDSIATATPLAVTPGPLGALATQGRLEMDDPYDYYTIPVAHGQKLVFAMTPAVGLQESLGEIRVYPQTPPAPPQVDVGETNAGATTIPDFTLRLLEPGTLVERGSSDLPLSAPERIELNVPVSGAWVLELGNPRGFVGNYTLDISVTPLALLDDDMATGPDAPSTCTDAIDGGNVIAGVIRDDDFIDVWRTEAVIGDTLTVTLKPGEDVDGADFDLYLYGPNCEYLASSGLGKGLIPKGTPDAIPWLPVLESGTYRAEVRRYNGVGNYALEFRAQHGQPTAPMNDALTAGDAPSSCPGTVLPVAGGSYQGTLTDGDAGDSYTFTAPANARIAVTVIPSAGNDLAIRLLAPVTCGTLGSSNNALSLPEAIAYGPSAFAGTYTLEITPVLGGGNYLFSVAVTPAQP